MRTGTQRHVHPALERDPVRVRPPAADRVDPSPAAPKPVRKLAGWPRFPRDVMTSPMVSKPWEPDSWRARPVAQAVEYEDEGELHAAVGTLQQLPPLVTSFEIEKLRAQIAEAQVGKRFMLQGGDCAESLADCRPEPIAAKLKILLQMSLVLVHAGERPVIRVGRFAGQYAKPRSSPTETRDGTTLPSYFGDLVNRPGFDANSRRADPWLLVDGYKHAALTLNFIRSLTDSGFADLQHPEYWDLAFLKSATLSQSLRKDYERTVREVGNAIRFMQALGEQKVEELSRVEFFTSHEGLNLWYESALIRKVPRREGYYDLSTHMPWIGERTRQLDGAHVELFRGIRNPVGIKVSAKADPKEVVALIETLNPDDEPGKIVLISRMGAGAVRDALPPLVETVKKSGRRVLWVSDPMHGNTISTSNGFKTRDFDAIVSELDAVMAVHDAQGTVFGGVHFELTGDDVTECIGGADGLTEDDLSKNYATLCDPRLNYGQALEMAFRIARRWKKE